MLLIVVSSLQIFLGLHELLGRPIPVGTDNLTWTLINSMQSDTHDLDASDNEAMVENYSKLSIALAVMHECFEPVKEPRTGRDLVADIIFRRRWVILIFSCHLDNFSIYPALGWLLSCKS